MFSNPIIRRYSYSQLRPQQAWVFGSLYVSVVLLIIFINSSMYIYTDAYKTFSHLYRGLFVQFGVLELFLLWIVAPANCSNVVAKEITDKAFDFFRLLPLKASQKAIGILVGRNMFSLIIASVNLALCLLFAFAGDLSLRLILQLLALLVGFVLLLNMMLLLFSVITYKKSKVTSVPVLIVAGFFALGPIMGGLTALIDNHQNVENVLANFFTLKLPLLYLIAFIAMCFSVWAYIGILRRFTFEYEALFNRSGAVLFNLTFNVIVYGLFYIYFFESSDAEDFGWAHCLITLLPLGIVPLLALNSFDKYLETTRTAENKDVVLGRLLMGSNFVTGIILYAVWLVFSILVGLAAKLDPVELLWFAAATLSFLLVILCLLETYVVWKPKNEKIGYLMSFAAFLYFVMPFIIGGIFDQEILFRLSPFGMLQILDSSFSEVQLLLLPILINFVWLFLLGFLIGKRYHDLIDIRASMKKHEALV